MKQPEALDILKLGYNVFLTGAAGSGKTFVLNQYIRYLREHGVGIGITASTGLAATHMNGVTIHSWSGLGLVKTIDKEFLKNLRKKSYLKKRFENTQVLLIDEISMLSGQTLDMVDEVCRNLKKDSRPFGGMQIILCGDLFQLPPIDRDAKLITESRVWAEMNVKICYLTEQYRQNDRKFSRVLGDIRRNEITTFTIQALKDRLNRRLPSQGKATKLFTHNVDVNALNDEKLGKIKRKLRTYSMIGKGNGILLEHLKKTCGTKELLEIKVGAVVMFVKNNLEEGYVNGTLGKVISFSAHDFPIVETVDGREIIAYPISWQIEEDHEVLAEITQVPLRLAWAITVHKSQGMSLDLAEMDLSKTFVQGMGYVALSRVRTMNGLRLLGINRLALQVNPAVVILDKKIQADSELVLEELYKLGILDKQKKQKRFLDQYKPKTEMTLF